MQNKQRKVYPIFKAAVVLLDGNGAVLLAKSRLPRRLQQKYLAAVSDHCPDNLLTFPAGHFDPKLEEPRQAALRELSEETGGYFFSDSVFTPWANGINNQALLDQCCKLEADWLRIVNPDPIELVMDNCVNNRVIRVSYFFFSLKVPGLTTEKLNFFCEQAAAQLKGRSFSVYREVAEYIAVPLAVFLAKLGEFANFSAMQDWFFADTTLVDSFVLFQDNVFKRSYQCNKGYFYALSRKYAAVTTLLKC